MTGERRKIIEQIQDVLIAHEFHEPGDGFAECDCGKWDDSGPLSHLEHVIGIIDGLAAE